MCFICLFFYFNFCIYIFFFFYFFFIYISFLFLFFFLFFNFFLFYFFFYFFYSYFLSCFFNLCSVTASSSRFCNSLLSNGILPAFLKILPVSRSIFLSAISIFVAPAKPTLNKIFPNSCSVMFLICKRSIAEKEYIDM